MDRHPQSTTRRVALKAYLSTDHISDATGKTISVTISKNCAAFGNPSAGATNATEVGNGWYYFDASTTDMGTGGPLIVRGTAPGVDNIERAFFIADAHNAGFDGIPSAVAGASGGTQINGANSGAVSYVNGITISNASGDGLVLSSSGSNGNGLNASGNGTADGIKATGGATGRGVHAIGGATSGAGIRCEASGGNSLGIHGLGFGSGPGMQFEGGTTGPGAKFIGGATSGDGIDVTTTSGDGLNLSPTAGHGINAAGNGTSKHGGVFTGSAGGTGDGIKGAAGAGGVDIRGNITGNVTGNLSGSAGSVAGAVGSVTGLTASNLDATISSRTKPADTQAAVTTVTNLTNAPTAGDLTATMKTSVQTAADAAVTANLSVIDIAGLLGKNVGFRNTSYVSGNLISYDLCIYDTSGHANTNDGATGLTHKFSVVNTYDGSNNILTSVTTKVS